MVAKSGSILSTHSSRCFLNTQCFLGPILQHTVLDLQHVQWHHSHTVHNCPQVLLTLKTKKHLHISSLHFLSCHSTHSSLSTHCFSSLYSQPNLLLIKTLLLLWHNYLSYSSLHSIHFPFSHNSLWYLEFSIQRPLRLHLPLAQRLQ